MNVEIRPQRISDAKRYFEILSSTNFHYLPAKPKTLEEFIIEKTEITRIEIRMPSKTKPVRESLLKGAIKRKASLHRCYVLKINALTAISIPKYPDFSWWLVRLKQYCCAAWC